MPAYKDKKTGKWQIYLSKYLKKNIDVTNIKHSKKVEDDFEECYKKTENYLQYIQKHNIGH